MKILVIGSGGREHAICWKLSQSPRTSQLYCAQGNAGIAEIATCYPANLNDAAGLAGLAESLHAELTVIGPEAPLVAGVAEAFHARNLRMIGPTSDAAQLEGKQADPELTRQIIRTDEFEKWQKEYMK